LLISYTLGVLSGTAYDSVGVAKIPSATVAVFRDDTDAKFATLTTDANGLWTTSLDTHLTYWASYWKGPQGPTAIFGRTDKGLTAV
jgi:hypothetical protein